MCIETPFPQPGGQLFMLIGNNLLVSCCIINWFPPSRHILRSFILFTLQNMCQVGQSLLRFQPFGARGAESDLEVDEFEADSVCKNDPSDGRVVALQSRSQNTSSRLDSADSPTSAPARQGSTVSAKKAVHDIDPVSLFRQMRTGTMSRGAASQHIPGSLKGAYALLSPPQATPDDEEEVKVDASMRCGKSFLSRPDQQAGAAYDMLAQIRGPKWNSDVISTKSSKSLNGREGDILLLTTSRSELRGEVVLSSSLGSSIGAPAGLKSFTSGPGKRPSILPNVSVDATPCLLALADFERVPVRTSAAGRPSGGLLCKLKKMIRH
ncbi:hypothetical protein Vretifemale_1565 [Volvox reticuliferus]|uniref:Uncharacterized protein n=1 Tax=Volvox reticuliferus TaxID=1737510 RepID=A0A8J4BY08_9CHLO|nr:hypothetical protein Vretifemale_1565 [Volvox reticuliferus]